MLRPLDTEELKKAVKPAPSKKFVVSKPPVIWLAMQTHSLARIADSTVWLTLQTQWSDSKCRLNSLTHDADSTVWQRSNCRNATQQGGAWLKMADSPAVAALKPSIQVSRHRSDCAPSRKSSRSDFTSDHRLYQESQCRRTHQDRGCNV